MPRTPDYDEIKKLKQLRITPTAISLYQQYAEQLDLSFNELVEQIARYPSVARGFASFVESQKRKLKIA